MFKTEREDFDHRPYIKNGEFVRGEVVTQGALIWVALFGYIGKIIVPDGFVTDLASLPWIAKLLIKKLGKHQRAAVLHDWLYRKRIGTKEWADEQFRLAMIEDGVVAWRIKLIMAGLKVGGWKSWNKDSKIEIVEA